MEPSFPLDLELYHCPGYSADMFRAERLPVLAKRTARICRKENYTAIAACGHSGLPLASAVAALLGIPLIAVRQEGFNGQHDQRIVNCLLEAKKTYRYAFVDDLVSTGATIKHTVKNINAVCGERVKLAGVFLYSAGPGEASATLRLSEVSIHREQDVKVHTLYEDWTNYFKRFPPRRRL